jgi:hypothetical protein
MDGCRSEDITLAKIICLFEKKIHVLILLFLIAFVSMIIVEETIIP